MDCVFQHTFDGKDKLNVLKQWQHIDCYDEEAIEDLSDQCLFRIAQAGVELCRKLMSDAIASSMAEDLCSPSLQTESHSATPSPDQIPYLNLSATISFVLSRKSEPVKQLDKAPQGEQTTASR